MARAVLLLALFLSPSLARSECADRYVSVWPSGGTLARDGQVLLTGYGPDEWVERPSFLRASMVDASGRRVRLRVVEQHQAGRSTQVLLRAVRPLEAGARVSLSIDRGPELPWIPSWDVGNDATAPEQNVARPQVLRVENELDAGMPCDPDVRRIVVGWSSAHSRSGLVRVGVESPSRQVEWLMPTVREGQFSTVHLSNATCSPGPFLLRMAVPYTIRVQALSADSPHTLESIWFPAPTRVERWHAPLR